LEVLALVKEIGSTLSGTYVNNIYSFGSSQLFRFRKPEEGDHWLVVAPKLGAWISRSVSERADTTGFTTKLRRELERARFVNAAQLDLDRVYEIEMEGNEKKKLIVELMPPGNLIVVDSRGKILLSMREVRSARRRIVRGETYTPPPQSRLSPLVIQHSDVEEILRSETTAGRVIGKHVALPKKYVAETLKKLGVVDGDPSSKLIGREEEVVNALRDLIDAAEKPSPCVCSTPSGDDIYVIAPTSVPIKQRGETVSQLCDELLLEKAGESEWEPSIEAQRRGELQATIATLKARTELLTTDATKIRSMAARAAKATPEEASSLLGEIGNRTSREAKTPASIASTLFDRAKTLEEEAREA
jgi:predicted ribosome quality control (RQC) complex YloA/Tae2 family protein